MVRKTIVMVIAVTAVIAFVVSVFFTSLPRGGEIPELVIHLDQDKCNRCGMLISDVRFAAAMFVEGELDFRKYDDIGCMLAEYITLDKDMIMEVIVHDYVSGEAVKVEEAWFVVAPRDKLVTPMGYGVAAFKNLEDAEQVAGEYGGEVMKWEGLVDKARHILGEAIPHA
ncbi:MAG TPA: hypothetical protein EYH45_03375 [Candidatus Caldiarchaeum subterraneum]|uniref:Nitrous oxide reductase accessory protein NosL n=1 Tax=Caldiarchaeum subterraneum TaxID=311458 RepID=A0A833EC90_CALS0|nr:hypothetical protein [Candidatus Caldarchaeum subterraneum]